MADVSLRLRPLRLSDEAEIVPAHLAMMAADHFALAVDYQPGMLWSTYLDRLEAQRRGLVVPAGRVPTTFLVADVGGQIVGRTTIRHELDDFHARLGGHIGYAVIAEHRRRGFATEILRQALIVIRAVGVDRVLVTCDDGNAASATVIERCGGVFESIADNKAGPAKRRYWFD